MNAVEVRKFSEELQQLLVKYRVRTYCISFVVQDDEVTNVPLMYNVDAGEKQRGISLARLSSQFAEAVIGSALRMLMQYNGLSLHQALGVAEESSRYAAAELSEQLDAKRQVVASASSGPDA